MLGVLLVCEGARVITLNSAAEALLARDDGLALQGRALAAAEPYESEMLRREVARALSRVDRHAGPSYAIATASRQSGKAPYLLLIAPIERGSTVGGSSEPAALIAIEDPEQPGLDFLHELHAAFEIIEGGQEVGPEIIETHGPSNVGENYREWIRSMRALAKALWGRTYSSSIS
ncbi:MAG: hypothetical protein EXQ95_15680 [Alphaproteobacteria bacterium]|nr:hypothetical protein [Alphaproteobacteria bacterium]